MSPLQAGTSEAGAPAEPCLQRFLGPAGDALTSPDKRSRGPPVFPDLLSHNLGPDQYPRFWSLFLKVISAVARSFWVTDLVIHSITERGLNKHPLVPGALR